jgi:hypothetical protein
MDIAASTEQVAGILHRADFTFETHHDGDSYRLLFEGGDAVFVNFGPWGDGVLITVSSPALQDIEADSVGAAIALSRVNELNRTHRLLKYMFVDDSLVVVYDLLGDTLQAGELINAIRTVAAGARELVEELQHEVGGASYEDWAEQVEYEYEDVDYDD